jgi:catechol 2,3-dioxygenase-like lactoylglutathione lyase family enzyme
MIPPPVRFHSTAAFVADIERSKAFYTGLLGQEIDLDFGKNVILKSGLTLWEIQPNHIIPHTLGHEHIAENRSTRFEFYFESSALAEVYEHLLAAGVEFLHPVHEEPWGQRTIRFFDPDRHLIEIGEPLETFIARLFSDGMRPEEITVKTGVPVEKVRELIR